MDFQWNQGNIEKYPNILILDDYMDRLIHTAVRFFVWNLILMMIWGFKLLSCLCPQCSRNLTPRNSTETHHPCFTNDVSCSASCRMDHDMGHVSVRGQSDRGFCINVWHKLQVSRVFLWIFFEGVLCCETLWMWYHEVSAVLGNVIVTHHCSNLWLSHVTVHDSWIA